MSPSRFEKRVELTHRLMAFDEQQRRLVSPAYYLGGLDEAGRGPLAGPVIAACVVFEPGVEVPGVNDSKKLTSRLREALVPKILEHATAWSIGWATAQEIDQLNILQATCLASRRALETLPIQPDHLLTDSLKFPASCPVTPLVRGDQQSQVIAAASILAKVCRDRIMQLLHVVYPDYVFNQHGGYPTKRHMQLLEIHGPSTLHRLSYHGVTFFQIRPSVRSLLRPPAMKRPEFPDWRMLLTCDVDACLAQLQSTVEQSTDNHSITMPLHLTSLLPESEWTL